jgi:hypothetical protein
MNFQSILNVFKRKPVAPPVDATGRPLLQRDPGRAYVVGGKLPKQTKITAPPNTREALQAAINWNRLQQSKGKLGMSGGQQQIMEVISQDPAAIRQLADQGKV